MPAAWRRRTAAVSLTAVLGLALLLAAARPPSLALGDPVNGGVTRAFAVPKQGFVESLVLRCEDLNRMFPRDPFPHLARGELLAWLGRTAEAGAAYETALRLVPFNEVARSRLQGLPAPR